MLKDLFPSRLTMAAAIGCAVFIPLAALSSYRWAVTHHDLVRVEQRADELDAAINAQGIGYKDRLTMCQANVAGLGISLQKQNKAVDDMAKAMIERTAQAQAAVDAAQARYLVAQQQANALLFAQPKPGETRCDAADRLILEQIR